jgi:alanyl-tRNA synthetase
MHAAIAPAVADSRQAVGHLVRSVCRRACRLARRELVRNQVIERIVAIPGIPTARAHSNA